MCFIIWYWRKWMGKFVITPLVFFLGFDRGRGMIELYNYMVKWVGGWGWRDSLGGRKGGTRFSLWRSNSLSSLMRIFIILFWGGFGFILFACSIWISWILLYMCCTFFFWRMLICLFVCTIVPPCFFFLFKFSTFTPLFLSLSFSLFFSFRIVYFPS